MTIAKEEFKIKAQMLAQRVKHYLISSVGKTTEQATEEEFYLALSISIREEIMINWSATNQSIDKHKARRIYYISLEWLQGRCFLNNMINIHWVDLVKEVLHILGKNFQSLINAELDAGLGNGGLGRLAACFMDSMATQGYPAMGYGLRYQYGIFEQELIYGVQIARPSTWLANTYPWEIRRDLHATNVSFNGHVIAEQNKHGQEVHHLTEAQEVRAMAYDMPIVGYSKGDDFGVSTLRLWSTKESSTNFSLAQFNAGDLGEAALNVSLTDVLYPNDMTPMGKMMRLKQEFLLVGASIHDIMKQYLSVYDDISEFGDKVRIQINDTHPALAVVELMRILTKTHELHWDDAWEITHAVCSYTNHTVLKESLEEWNCEMVKELLPRQYHIIEKINWGFCNRIRDKFPNDEERIQRMSILENGKVRMANLAIAGCHKVNGVAAIHTRILKETIFKDFFELYPDKFVNVTNGVTPRRWLVKCNPHLTQLISHYIGDDWITDLSKLKKLADHADDPQLQNEFLNIKKGNKARLIRAITKARKEKYGKECDLDKELFRDPDVLYDVQVKRIHEYKRQLMNALNALMIYNDIKENPDSRPIRRMIIMAGKAAPGYVMAINIIRLFYIISRKINSDPVAGEKLKVVLIENYNVTKAELIIPACDLSEQISTAGQEASGTGCMKLSLNGAMTIGTEDGANVEMRESVTDDYWPFSFGHSADENHDLTFSGSYDPVKIKESNPKIHQALEMLREGLAENEAEQHILSDIYNSLLTGPTPDRFFVLNDLEDYYETQKRVEELYQDESKWAKYCIHNIAGMHRFSSDESIANYAEKIWDIKPLPMDVEELEHVRTLFKESDRCAIPAS
ncbi:MAG: Maltodextrin phosphorylase [Chlamydiia bacterium]|nr:Maltodextrin phosphorylase [Chlamydiia bacterium]